MLSEEQLLQARRFCDRTEPKYMRGLINEIDRLRANAAELYRLAVEPCAFAPRSNPDFPAHTTDQSRALRQAVIDMCGAE